VINIERCLTARAKNRAALPEKRSARIVREARDAPLAPCDKGFTSVIDVRKGRTMMNRRQFLCVSAASLACVGQVSAATYDLVIKGARVIDPSVGLDAVRDVAIVAGKIAAVEADIKGDAADTIDARGKIVAPGLIDIHTHAARVAEGARICLDDGVTGWVDCGSAGADNIDQVAAAARAAPQIGRVLVNISRTGNASDGELMDINRANVGLARGAIARHRDVVIGLKARLTHNIAGTNDLEGLRRAQEAAAPFGLPVMIHMGQSVSPMRAILALLKRGDIVTHMYAPAPNGILDDDGHLFPDVAAARRRGVIFDLGNGGTGHLRWDVVERATRQGFWPDTLSTDWTANSRDNPSVMDFPNVMSKFIMLGLPLAQVIACATVNAARVFPAFDDRGTLNIGAPADVAIMELREGTFAFVDNYKGTRTGHQRLFPVATVLAGKRTPARA
jgi:dihydroorotase